MSVLNSRLPKATIWLCSTFSAPLEQRNRTEYVRKKKKHWFEHLVNLSLRRIGASRTLSITAICCTPLKCENSWLSCANEPTSRWNHAIHRRSLFVAVFWPACFFRLPSTNVKDIISLFVILSLFFKIYLRVLTWNYCLKQLGSRQTVTIHPSSVLFHTKPSCIVFTELIQTGKRYVRQVTLIDRDWIEELPKETLLQLRQV